MMKRISVLLLAAAITFGLTSGGTALAQPPHSPDSFQGHPIEKPDMKGPDGGNFKRPDVERPGKEMRDNFRHDKKDFQNRGEQGKKSFKDKMKHDKKFEKRHEGKDFRPDEHKNRPDFGKPDHNMRPGDHRGMPDFGQPRN